MKVYIFEEWNCGEIVVFTSKEKRDKFFSEYVQKMINECNEPPRLQDDYSMKEVELDPDFNEWWNT